LHDVLIAAGALPVAAMLSNAGVGGVFGFEDFKINLQIVAALLTIVGYSINDTIVIFDRVREVRGRNPIVTLDMFNRSLNETLSRTILTATTVFVTLLVLYFGGGESIHGFAFCMVVGSISGVYSTIYIASPVVLWMMDREAKKAAASKSNKKPVATAKP
jgi:SecD/SecF fusion protein